MEEIHSLKLKSDNFEVEFGIIPTIIDIDKSLVDDSRKQTISNGLRTVNAQLSANDQKIDTLNKEIDRLTNHADGIDYMVAVGSGVLVGLIDSFWVGSFDFRSAKAWSNRQVNEFVMKVAQSKGYKGKRLDGAIKFLEGKFKIPTDSLWKRQQVGISERSHHLDDMAHHPTPIGLFFSILTQFTQSGYFQNHQGTFFKIIVDETRQMFVGTDIRSKIFAGTVNWFFHLVSDMSGSNKTAGVGIGVPGPILSLIKELSAIPGFNKTGVVKKAHEAFVKSRFDLRSELAVGHLMARQAVPVILNEFIVRAFYFIRRLVKEAKEKKDFAKITWENTLPWKNRTIVRMLTIATGTFTVIDLADAAIRAGVKSGGTALVFAKEFLLHVNFVGAGRFAVAVSTDVYMGVKRSKLRNQRLILYSEQLHLMNATVFYSQAGVWLAAETTHQTINEAIRMMEKATSAFQKSILENSSSLDNIEQYVPKVEENNPGMTNQIQRLIEY